MPLTDTKLRALYSKPYFGKTELSDRDGLSARVTERGTISWQYRYRYRYRYRWQGKAARLKIGRYPDLKLADARALIPAIRGALVSVMNIPEFSEISSTRSMMSH
ncbi:Arm DNA-binding domain-containing protein [Aeromonas allosaccharophila]|uniref:Arm DNA-binding domain-containing protein n=1 Tax=Aeromonas allosaccharophila TaxID=656 RepID=UPI003D19D6EF